MTKGLAAFDDLVAEATRAASAFDGSRLEKIVSALCDEVENLEHQSDIGREELLRVQGELSRFVQLCEGLHHTLFGTMMSVLAGAQPPTYAHIAAKRRQAHNHFSNGYLRRYG